MSHLTIRPGYWAGLLLLAVLGLSPASASDVPSNPSSVVDVPLPGDTPEAAERIKAPPKPQANAKRQQGAKAKAGKRAIGSKAKPGKAKATKPKVGNSGKATVGKAAAAKAKQRQSKKLKNAGG